MSEMLCKRLHNSSKCNVVGRSSVKTKDVLSKTTSKYKNQFDLNDTDGGNISFPYLRPADNSLLLPCYSSVLNRTVVEGINISVINIKDLDQLQTDLEKLLAANVTRSRLLNTELKHADLADDRLEKKAKFFDKPPSPKQRKIGEKIKHTAIIKPEPEEPKIVLPNNESEAKFWLSVDAYCAPISADDKIFLDELIEEANKSIETKVDEVGNHYVENWNLDSQQNGNMPGRPTKPKSQQPFPKKNSFFNEESYANSLIMPGSQEKLKGLIMKSVNYGICLDKRLRNELVELGILNLEENKKDKMNEEPDEILQKIQLYQQQLRTLNESNVRELNRLRHAVNRDLTRQEYVNKLNEVDNNIMDIYTKLLNATPKEKNILLWEAVKVIELQKLLHTEAAEISDILI